MSDGFRGGLQALDATRLSACDPAGHLTVTPAFTPHRDQRFRRGPRTRRAERGEDVKHTRPALATLVVTAILAALTAQTVSAEPASAPEDVGVSIGGEVLDELLEIFGDDDDDDDDGDGDGDDEGDEDDGLEIGDLEIDDIEIDDIEIDPLEDLLEIVEELLEELVVEFVNDAQGEVITLVSGVVCFVRQKILAGDPTPPICTP